MKEYDDYPELFTPPEQKTPPEYEEHPQFNKMPCEIFDSAEIAPEKNVHKKRNKTAAMKLASLTLSSALVTATAAVGVSNIVKKETVAENNVQDVSNVVVEKAPIEEAPIEFSIDEVPIVQAAVEPPKVEPPPVEAPKVETPIVETPIVETPIVETPIVETPKVEPPPVEAPARAEITKDGVLTVKTVVDGLNEKRPATAILNIYLENEEAANIQVEMEFDENENCWIGESITWSDAMTAENADGKALYIEVDEIVQGDKEIKVSYGQSEIVIDKNDKIRWGENKNEEKE